MLASLLAAPGLVLCWDAAKSLAAVPHAVFFHVPKAGGQSLSEALRHQRLLNCSVAVGIPAVISLRQPWVVDGVRRMDAMHFTPDDLDQFALGRLQLKSGFTLQTSYVHWSGRDVSLAAEAGQHLLAAAAAAERRIAFVRNPYERIVAGMRQLMDPAYGAAWGRPYPVTFEPFVKWLADGIDSGQLHWCCTPYITHLRPASDYASDATFVGRLEHVREDWPRALRHMMHGLKANRSGEVQNFQWGGLHANQRSGAQELACSNSKSCWRELLNHTPHTPMTLQLTNRLYRVDFVRLNYTMAWQPSVVKPAVGG